MTPREANNLALANDYLSEVKARVDKDYIAGRIDSHAARGRLTIALQTWMEIASGEREGK